MLRLLEVCEKGSRALLLHLLPGGAADGRVGGDEQDGLVSPVLCCKPLEQRVGVRGVTDLERTMVPVVARPVEDDDASSPPERDEAGPPVDELARVFELSREEQVVAVEQVQRRLRGHIEAR